VIFSSENADDIRKYYLHTYIKVKEHADLLFYIQRVDRQTVQGVTETGQEFVLYMDDKNPYEIDYVLPHKSFFQYEKDACQLYRVPNKQYYRGLNVENTRIARLDKTGKKVPFNQDIDFKVLKAFVSKQPFYTLSNAAGKANPNGCYSLVLTPRMVYHRALKAIYVDFTPVATVDVTTKTITMLQPVFKAEIAAFLRQSNEQDLFKFQ
jgi:hypothetical protein